MFPEVASESPLLQNLNPEQLAAVTLPATHALILAGAGSGKTRVLTTRIAWLLQTGQVASSGILAVTFTNKAAKEMLVRLSAMLPVNVRGMWIGTFHGLCNRFLRAHYKLANLPQSFQILDTQDQLSAIKRLCKQFNVDDERFPPKQLMYFIAGCKEDGQRAKDVPVRDDEGRKKVEIYALYEEQCQREGVVDFGELMLRSYELLRDNAPVREHYQRRLRHILIDEINHALALALLFVQCVNLYFFATFFVAHRHVFGALAVFLAAGDEIHQLLGWKTFVVNIELFAQALDARELVLRVENLERRWQIGQLVMRAQKAVAQAVKGANPHAAYIHRQHAGQTQQHFLGGLVGEGHRQNATGSHLAGLQQPGDARGQHAGFA